MDTKLIYIIKFSVLNFRPLRHYFMYFIPLHFKLFNGADVFIVELILLYHILFDKVGKDVHPCVQHLQPINPHNHIDEIKNKPF